MLDLGSVPFSTFGSYFAFSLRDGALMLRSVHGNARYAENDALCRIEMLQDGQIVPFRLAGVPHRLRLIAEGGTVEICFSAADQIRIHGEKVGVRLTWTTDYFSHGWQHTPNRWQFDVFAPQIKVMVTALTGDCALASSWNERRADQLVFDCTPNAGEFDLVIDPFDSVWSARPVSDSFTGCAAQAHSAFDCWTHSLPAVPPEYAPTRELAAYVLWSCAVNPHGKITRQTLLMSKSWMASVWSWDHCFNALALANAYPDLAWDQFMTVFDHQDTFGALPDCVNDHHVTWSFVKPPIHGWTLRQLMQSPACVTPERLAHIYAPLARWTRFWFEHRDANGNGFPEYHHGNDSGWDNGTVFHGGVPVESPDVCAFLVLQLETLAELAARLGDADATNRWRQQSADLLTRMIAHFWHDDHFGAWRLDYGQMQRVESPSLMLYLPLILGSRLPSSVSRPLIERLRREGELLTPHGLASEPLDSLLYRDDGYWRGAVWGAPILLILDGLRDLGETELARTIARRFCAAVARSGMAENFDAKTGMPLRDKAYSWTASIFLLIARDFVSNID
ncbi:MAG: hypothetical protein IAE80_12950 [Anaerolinea sp.]|nr:hypothetical protein [Anaerolinea sp.]